MEETERLRGVVKDCVHCGFCLPACPTYQLWAEEMDSPRGRIYLVNQILEGAEMTPAAAEHFDRCLGCMACMTACPSGVQYDQLIEAASGHHLFAERYDRAGARAPRRSRRSLYSRRSRCSRRARRTGGAAAGACGTGGHLLAVPLSAAAAGRDRAVEGGAAYRA